MRTETIYLSEDKSVFLTTYILTPSREMQNFWNRPAVLVLPGGGYRSCSAREGEPVAMAFLAEGYNAFVLNYSVKEKSAFPRPLEDAEKAYRRILENCDDWFVNPEKIAVCGFSAGGHLAAALSTMGKVRPKAMILGYPCILASIGDVLANPVPSLEKQVDEKTPPCFIFSTADDKTVPIENSLEFAVALNKKNIPFEMHIFSKGNHGLSLAKPHTASGRKEMQDVDVRKWFPMCISWLNKMFL